MSILSVGKYPPNLIDIDEDSTTLTAGGKRIGKAASLGNPLSYDKASLISRDEQFRPVLDDWDRLLSFEIERRTDSRRDTMLNAYWKTLIAGATDRCEEVDDEYGRYFIDWYSNYRTAILELASAAVASKPSGLSPDEGALLYNKCVRDAALGRRFGFTDGGYMGLFPSGTRAMDSVVLLSGCWLPVVIRYHSGHYEFVGTCFIQGINLDEIMDDLEIREEFFKLQ